MSDSLTRLIAPSVLSREKLTHGKVRFLRKKMYKKYREQNWLIALNVLSPEKLTHGKVRLETGGDTSHPKWQTCYCSILLLTCGMQTEAKERFFKVRGTSISLWTASHNP